MVKGQNEVPSDPRGRRVAPQNRTFWAETLVLNLTVTRAIETGKTDISTFYKGECEFCTKVEKEPNPRGLAPFLGFSAT